jgi:hypothetical protein
MELRVASALICANFAINPDIVNVDFIKIDSINAFMNMSEITLMSAKSSPN